MITITGKGNVKLKNIKIFPPVFKYHNYIFEIHLGLKFDSTYPPPAANSPLKSNLSVAWSLI